MAEEDIQGIIQNISLGTEQYTPLYPYLREVFLNDAPLLNRAEREVAEGQSYNIIVYDVRPFNYTLSGTAISSTSQTTFYLADASPLQVGDVLEFEGVASGAATGVYERVEITADPNVAVTPNQITVRRGRETTTPQTNDLSGGYTNIRLIGNSRTGAEINQTGTRAVRYAIPQNVQTHQFPIQVSGLANAVQNTRLPNGVRDVFTLEQKTKLVDMERSIESTLYYGLGEKPQAVGDRAKCVGLRALISYFGGMGVPPASGTNTNVFTNIGGSYTFLQFTNHLQAAFNGGGDPDVVLCSTGMMTGLQTWGFAKQFLTDVQETKAGVKINQVQMPFLGKPITFIPSYVMNKNGISWCALTWRDLRIRRIREELWMLRGVQGDAFMGDFLGDFAPEIGHPGWHAWGEGITSFS